MTATTKTPATAALSRRSFLKVSAMTGGALAVGIDLSGCAHVDMTGDVPGEFQPSAYLRIFPDDRVVFVLDKAEMGQGVYTGMAQMAAEELDIPAERIDVEFAPVHGDYGNTTMGGFQATGGSTSVPDSWEKLREAGATARAHLVQAAADKWDVPAEWLRTEDGWVIDDKSNRRLRYGELTTAAAQTSIGDIKLKDPKDFKVIGQSVTRKDALLKSTGKAAFGMDVQMQGLLTAVVLRPPFLGGKVKSFDAAAAKKQPGVVDVFEIPHGVAVVADTYWKARQASSKVSVTWDESGRIAVDTKKLRETYDKLAKTTDEDKISVEVDEGDLEDEAKKASKTIEAIYEAPFLQHAPMEPQNTTAWVRGDKVDIWSPTQSPSVAQEAAVRVAGVSRDNVTFHQTFLGGGFGRRGMGDFVEEAVAVSKKLQRPVKVVWSREDDTQNGFLRPAATSRFVATLDDKGWPTTMKHDLVSQSIMASIAGKMLSAFPPEWIPHAITDYLSETFGNVLRDGMITDPVVLEGASEIGYGIHHRQLTFRQHEPGVPVGFWRSVGHSSNAFAVEGFIDELAHAAQEDPFTFRQKLLKKGNAERHLGVLELAAEKAGWGKPLPPGRFRGIAQHSSFNSYCGMVMEVERADERIVVKRVVVSADVGIVVNPDIVKAQLESGVIYALSAALKQAITHKAGAIEQSNFHDYQMLRMHESPAIECHLVDSREDPTGVGEISVPPTAPALANAVFAATGERYRRLPIEPAMLPPTQRGKLAAVVDPIGVRQGDSVRSAP
jgi:isoquinoline 1-oxidoreductase beta subunit